MTRRKSKAAIALVCALCALLTAAVLSPAYAGAQAANDEYNLTVPGNAGGSGGANGSQGSGSGSHASSSGGAPVLPIALAVVAAGCVGVATWRLRGRSSGGGESVPPGASTATGKSQ